MLIYQNVAKDWLVRRVMWHHYFLQTSKKGEKKTTTEISRAVRTVETFAENTAFCCWTPLLIVKRLRTYVFRALNLIIKMGKSGNFTKKSNKQRIPAAAESFCWFRCCSRTIPRCDPLLLCTEMLFVLVPTSVSHQQALINKLLNIQRHQISVLTFRTISWQAQPVLLPSDTLVKHT